MDYGIIYLDPELKLFQLISPCNSDVSVLSDPFSDSEGETDFQPPDLVGKDVCSVFKFSPLFNEIINNVGPNLEGIKTMMAETPDQIRARNVFTQVKKKVPLMAQIKIVNLMNDKEIAFGEEVEGDAEFIPDEKKTWEDLKDEVFRSRNILRNIRKLTEKEKSKKLLLAQSELEAYETMSGYWRLLSEYKEFKISPPGYNAYAGPDKHWLETEPIPWEIMEDSRAKVLAWLSKHFTTY